MMLINISKDKILVNYTLIVNVLFYFVKKNKLNNIILNMKGEFIFSKK